MKPEVRKTAISGVGAVLGQGAWSRAWLAGHAGRLSPAERAQVHDLLTGTLRWLGRLDALMAAHARRRPDPWVRDAVRVALYQLDQGSREPAHAVVNETVELARRVKGERVAGWVNGVLRAFLRAPDRAAAFVGPGAEADARAFPPWLYQRFVEAWGPDEARRVADGMNRPAVVDLRVNRGRLARLELSARLAGQGVLTEPLAGLADGLAVTGGRGLFDDDGWSAADWIVQDRTSQAVTAALGRLLTGRVLDACSGGGVKLLGWRDLPAVHELVAVDVQAARLEKGRGLLERWFQGRSGLAPVHHVAVDASATGFPDASFDAVVVDAPCSGTGTLRRRPEIRHRVTPQAVADLAGLQGRLLAEAARLTRPGGTLAYAVCSLLPDEGPAVVTRFLEAHARFSAVDGVFPDAPGATANGAVTRLFDPDRPGDGFQVAVLRRER